MTQTSTGLAKGAAAPESANGDRIGFGIGCAVVGLFGMSVMDACAKLLGSGYAVSQVILARNGIGALAVVVFVLLTGSGLACLRPKRPLLLVLRTLLNLVTSFLFFTSLRYLPLADAFAITFAAPLFITALSVPLLGERVGLRRWVAVVVGFVGVLVVVQPGTTSFRVEALLPLGGALSYALAMLMGRRMTREMSTAAIMFWPALGAAGATLLLMPAQWQMPSLPDTGLFVFLGIIGTGGMALITQGYRYAPAAVVAPFDYSVLVWGVILGWGLWQEVPAPNVWVGAGILTASGLYILHRETRKPKPVQPVPGPMGPTS